MDTLTGVILNNDVLVFDKDGHRCVEHARTGDKVGINVVCAELPCTKLPFFASHNCYTYTLFPSLASDT